MNRLRHSWALAKISFSVMFQHRKLMVFPALITVFTIGIAAFFVAPVIFHPSGHSVFSAEHWAAVKNTYLHESSQNGANPQYGLTTLGFAYLAVVYFVSMFAATFFNVAFYHEILAAFRGGGVSIGRGLKFAASRWQAVLLWTMFAGLVGFLISLIEQRLSWAGKIIAKLIGLAWSLASVFVIPVLVVESETSNPFKVLKRSAEVLRRTWGEALIGYTGASFGSGIFLLLSVMFWAATVALSVLIHSPLILAGGAVLWFVALCVLSYLMHVAGQIFRGALYLYAAEQVVAGPYTEEMFHKAWKHRKEC